MTKLNKQKIQKTLIDDTRQNTSNPKIMDLIRSLSEEIDADIFLYSGTLDREQADKFLKACEVAQSNSHRENAALFLTTYGGDPSAAYLIAKYIKKTYKKFILYIFGYCKSAGTLLAIGADEIVMTHRGELGPLDVQMVKPDELILRSSGLDISEAINALNSHAFSIFESNFLQLLLRGGGTITTKTAADIAASIAIGILSPVSHQINPMLLGESRRAMKIAYDYGIRLNATPEIVSKLITGYSAHGFVIDFDEAKDIFGNVRLANEHEVVVEHYLLELLEETTEHGCLREPHPEGFVAYFNPEMEKNHDTEKPKRQISDSEKSESSGEKRDEQISKFPRNRRNNKRKTETA